MMIKVVRVVAAMAALGLVMAAAGDVVSPLGFERYAAAALANVWFLSHRSGCVDWPVEHSPNVGT